MPATTKQIEANRRNAQKSTGPKTAAGKERSRANATTHGLTAATTITQPVRHENPAEFTLMRDALLEDCKPVGAREEMCVQMMAAAYKRMQRAEAMEVAFFNGAMDAMQISYGKPPQPTENDALGCALAMGKKGNKLTWENLARYRRAAWLDYNRAVEQLRKLQSERRSAELHAAKMAASAAASTKMASFCVPALQPPAIAQTTPLNQVTNVAAPPPSPEAEPETLPMAA